MKYVSTLLFCALSMFGMAQSSSTQFGFLKDSATGEFIVLASVTNTQSQQTVMTSTKGRFGIQVKEGEILAFAAVGYFFDTLQFRKKSILNDTLIFYLKPLANYLGNVNVYAKGMSRYQLDSIQRRNSFLKNISNYTIPTISKANSGAGIAFNIDRFSKREKQKRTALQFFENFEKEAYINYRFNENLVSKYSKMKQDELMQFMQKHRPNYGWLRKHPTEEDLMYYINEKLKLQ